MMKPLCVLLLLALLTACGAPATPAPTVAPEPTATPEPPMAVEVTQCGYGGDFGFVTTGGTLTNNTDQSHARVTAAVALLKNGQVVRTDEVYLVSSGTNLGVLHGLDYVSKTGGLAPGETWEWSIAYPLDKLTEPFECEVSVTRYE